MSTSDLDPAADVRAAMRLEHLGSLAHLGAGLAHEMNAPLSTVLTNLDVVLERFGQLDLPSDQVRPLVDALVEARAGVDRVSGLVQSLQRLGRPPRADPRASLAEGVRLGAALTGHVARHRAQVSIEEVSPCEVQVGIGALAEMMVLLMLHAVRDLPDGGAASQRLQLRSSVRSGGVGVVEVCLTSRVAREPPAQWPDRLIERAREHDGSLSMESDASGARFTLLLPAVMGGEAKIARPRRGRGGPSTRGRVLLAEDDPMVRRALSRGLGDKHDLVVVDSGRDALHMIRQSPHWDAIVCDLMMPDVTGRQLYAHLATERPELCMRMIFVTGGAFTPEDQSFVDSLDNPVLDKPFRIGVLRDLIDAAVALAAPKTAS